MEPKQKTDGFRQPIASTQAGHPTLLDILSFQEANPVDKLVLLYLCHASDGRPLQATYSEIAAACSITSRSVQTAVHWLADAGLIGVKRSRTAGAAYVYSARLETELELERPWPEPEKIAPDIPEQEGD